MRPIKNNKLLKWAGALALQAMIMLPQANALPTLQAYLNGAAGGDGSVTVGTTTIEDADTWRRTTTAGNLVDLTLQGVYSPTGVTSIDSGFLMITVPDKEKLSLVFDIPSKGLLDNTVLQQFYYDSNTAFETYLATHYTLTGTPPVQFNEHSPLGADASLVDLYAIPLEWLQDGLGTFSPLTGQALQDCNAEINTCTAISNKPGELKNLRLGFNDVAWAHLDLAARVTTKTGGSTFEINPASHDSTWRDKDKLPPSEVPEPGSLALIGLGLVTLLVRRRFS